MESNYMDKMAQIDNISYICLDSKWKNHYAKRIENLIDEIRT